MSERLAAALRAQLARRRAVLDGGARHVGWKLAFDIAEIDAVTGGAPAFGYLTSASVLDDGARYEAAGDGALRAETELVVEVGGGYAVGLELVDVARPPDDLEGIVAANVFHRAVAFGPARPAIGTRATLAVDGEVREVADVAVDAVKLLATLNSLLRAVGEELRPGDLVLCGSSCHVPVRPGDAVVAAIDGLGRVSARIAG